MTSQVSVVVVLLEFWVRYNKRKFRQEGKGKKSFTIRVNRFGLCNYKQNVGEEGKRSRV